MIKFDFLDKLYQQFISNIAKDSAQDSISMIVLNGARDSNLNLVLDDISKMGKMHRVDINTFITEANLTRIFSEADNNQESILFFDEADALFGKRSEVTDSHDRFANIETAYLLEKIKNHHGIVVFASNNRQSLKLPFISEADILIDFPAILTLIRKYSRRKRKPAKYRRS